MVNQIIVIIALFIIYFNISGLATTNILRLTAGNTLPVLSSTCCCDSCGTKITPFFQLPILSYILCKGRCRTCKSKIPLYSLILEIVILAGMFMISCLSGFSVIGVFFCFLYYELIRVIVILVRGRRKDQFVRQYLIAVLAMIPFYLTTVFVSMLYGIV